MASEDNTALDVLIPELWSQQMLEGLYQAGEVMNRVQRVDGEVSALGDILHLPLMAAWSVNDVTAATGAVTDQVNTPTEQQLTINQWREVTWSVVEKSAKQASKSWPEDFKRDAIRAIKQDVEAKVLALYSDVTSYTQGDSSSQAGEDILTAAIGQLMGNNLGDALRDPNRATFAFHTSQWESLKKIKEYSQAQITGESMGGAMKMSIPNLYGIPVFFNTQVASSGSARQNLLFIREAFACGIQSNPEFKELTSTGLNRRFNVNILYGVKTRAQDRAVLIKTKA